MKITVPKYKIVDRSGPDHAPVFTVMVICGEHGYI